MTTITTRAGKGSALSYAEMDANFTNLNTDKVDVSALAPYETSAHAAATYATQTTVTANALAALQKASNLSDVSNTTTARNNLGVSATGADPAYNVKSANLSDVGNVITARSNLGLGTAATLSAGTAANNVVQLDVTAKLPAVDGSALINLPTSSSPNVRQTILSGPVDSNGFSSFGGSTGSTTVTATGTLKATVSAGGDANYTGSITNPSWTGLSTNGTMYVYLDITSGGVVTTGSTALAPVYQWGGTYSTTSNQNTYNIQEATMKVGNGASAIQVYRVFVGEVTVAGGVTTAIVWYALQGRYQSAFTATLPSGSQSISFSHNIGTMEIQSPVLEFECTTADNGWANGERFVNPLVNTGTLTNNSSVSIANAKVINWIIGNNASPYYGISKTTFASFLLTLSSWKYRIKAQRGW